MRSLQASRIIEENAHARAFARLVRDWHTSEWTTAGYRLTSALDGEQTIRQIASDKSAPELTHDER
jgi:hypothetical protein